MNHFQAKRGYDGSYTGREGRTYTGSDYRNVAGNVGDFADNDEGIVANGFTKANVLWCEDAIGETKKCTRQSNRINSAA